MKKYVILFVLLVAFLLTSCAPVTISKCVDDYKYNGDKITSIYKECITQTPEKVPPIHIKHKELYE